MNISLFCPRYLWAGGGSVLFSRRLAEELAARGHTVTLVTDAPPPNPKYPEPSPAGCTLRTVARDTAAERRAQARVDWQNRRGFHRLTRWLLSSGKQQLIAAGPWCPELTEARNFADTEVFIAVNTGSTALGENLRHALAWRHGQVRLSIPLFHPREEFAGYEQHDITHLQFDAVGTLSDHERDFLGRRGWPLPLIRTIGAGADPLPSPAFSFRERFRVPDAAPLVLFLGRQIHNKGVPHVLAAMDEVWDRHPDARLAIVGFTHNPPAWMEGLLDRSRHPARERVIRLDDADTETREAALAACDVMAAPSISDSFGIACLDAWRHAKPVVACRDTCSETIVQDGVNGLLVPFGDTPAIAAALLGAITDPVRAREMGLAGQALWRERFQWSHVTDRVEELIDLVRGNKRLPAPAGAPPRLAIGMVWDDMTRLGGVNTWILQSVSGLGRRGIDVWLLDLGDEERGEVDVSAVEHRVLTLARGRRETAGGHRRRIRREIESRGIRFLLFHEHRFGEDVLEALPEGFPAANVLHVDRPDDKYYDLAAALDPWLGGQICVSPRIRDRLLPRLPEPRRNRVEYLPLGVVLPPALPPRATGRGPLRLVHAGRVAREQKRVQDLAPFLTALDAAGTPWELDVFGDGPDLASLRDELAPWVKRGAARLHGSVAPGVVHGALLRAHALLLFSDFEGLPLVLLEAMARSVVPVVTRIPSGISDILADGRDALLFPVGDTAAAAAAVRSLANPEHHRALALAARATAEGFDLERQLDLYAERIRSLAAAAPDLSGRPSRHRAGQRLA